MTKSNLNRTETEKKGAAIYELAIHYRGLIIDESVAIEGLCEVVVSSFFCGSESRKSALMIGVILAHRSFTFDNKKRVVMMIMKNYYPKMYEEFGKDMEVNFKYIMEMRNIVAHRKMLATDLIIENFDFDTIRFENFGTNDNKPKMLIQEINNDLMDDVIERCRKVTKILFALIDLVRKGEGKSK